MKTIIKELPKIELHLHLDGSVRVSSVAEILHIEKQVAFEKMVCDNNTKSLTDYLTKFELPLEAMQKKEHIKRLTKELLEDLKEEHVIYVELRFAPMLHTKKGLTQKEVLDSLIEGMKEVEGITCKLILCCMRNDFDQQNKNNLETLKIAKQYIDFYVVAIDLAGDESKYPTELFQDLFSKAEELQIPYTIHAGEASSYHSIESALHMHASRIGHGISAIQNKELMNELKKKQILLEICPKSNVDTHIVTTKKDHPIKDLYKHCLISINTDNRTVSNITLTEEYEDFIRLFGFTIEDLKICNLNAIEHAFCKQEEKEKLKKQMEEYYDTTY